MKLWKGRFQKEADPKTNDFNSSISIDSRMYKEDIEGSIAHATMLGAAGIIDKGESEKICAELEKIEKDIETGALHIDPDAEDIHTFIEGELTARIGDAGKRLHTARQPQRSGCAGRSSDAAQGVRGAYGTVKRAHQRTVRPGGGICRHRYAGLHAFAARTAHHVRASFNGVCRNVPARHRPYAGRVKAYGRLPARLRRFGRNDVPARP